MKYKTLMGLIDSHNPRGNNRNVLAVKSRTEAEKVLMPSTALFPLVHRLIPVTAFSNKVPLRRAGEKPVQNLSGGLYGFCLPAQAVERNIGP
jgi:hypothetical protein